VFDLRKKIKIYIKNGAAMCGQKVELGGFPIHSVDTLQEAELLLNSNPYKGEPLDVFVGKLIKASLVEAQPDKAVELAAALKGAFNGNHSAATNSSLVTNMHKAFGED